jgi:putative transposase
VKVGEQHIVLPKAGLVRYRNSRAMSGRVKQATVSWDGLRWYVSVLVECEVSAPTPPSGAPVGVDLGIAQSVTLSDGRVWQLPVPTCDERAKAARLQRQISRRTDGSCRRTKAQAQFTRFYRRLIHRRVDSMHKITTLLAKSHSQVVVEDLSVRNMTASAAGTRDNPGVNVSKKKQLNRAIRDQSFREFRRQLTYKSAWYGSQVVPVPPAYTSQRCARCGFVDAANRPSQASFACRSCGHRAHADHNAAVNILAAGTAAAAQGAAAHAGR